jgi:hypothetical protein
MHAGFTDVAVTDVTEAWEEVTRARAAAFEASKDRLRRVTHGQEEVFLRLQVRPGSQVHLVWVEDWFIVFGGKRIASAYAYAFQWWVYADAAPSPYCPWYIAGVLHQDRRPVRPGQAWWGHHHRAQAVTLIVQSNEHGARNRMTGALGRRLQGGGAWGQWEGDLCGNGGGGPPRHSSPRGCGRHHAGGAGREQALDKEEGAKGDKSAPHCHTEGGQGAQRAEQP